MIPSEVLVTGDPCRRRAPRSLAMLDSRFGGASGTTRSPCRIVDISASGARLMLYQDFEPGTAIRLVIPAKGLVDAHIVWGNGREAGCRFDQPLDEAALNLVQRAAKAPKA